MIQSINFPIAPSCVAPYGGWDALKDRLDALCVDGVEGIWDPDEIDERFPASMLTGCHLVFYPDWLDFYRENTSELLRKFGSMETVLKAFPGPKPEDLVRVFRADLARAIRYGAKYTVFHVSDVSQEECWTYKWLHDDYAVMDASLEIINEILRGVEHTFDFLVENQWWPGFTFTEPKKTEYLLSRINYPRVGIMLDTGHLMNTNPALKTQEEGVEYIRGHYRAHGELAKAVLGLHFHQSLSGDYVRGHVGTYPESVPRDFFEGFSVNYFHVQHIDRHDPWTVPEAGLLLHEIAPRYLTHELIGKENCPQLEATKLQLDAIQKGFALL
ncbi:MAG: sugar phosphate isomerase/epimerase [Clostridia bacterium]|nr:sugar phosphate isomerase/epimerase [Clostridia bacterium]